MTSHLDKKLITEAEEEDMMMMMTMMMMTIAAVVTETVDSVASLKASSSKGSSGLDCRIEGRIKWMGPNF